MELAAHSLPVPNEAFPDAALSPFGPFHFRLEHGNQRSNTTFIAPQGNGPIHQR
jgi:hypothetical protein